jgi:hypothetical protein
MIKKYFIKNFKNVKKLDIKLYRIFTSKIAKCIMDLTAYFNDSFNNFNFGQTIFHPV